MKYIEPTKEEAGAFNQDLQDLLKKHSLVLNVIPQFQPNETTKSFEVAAVMLIRKTVEENETNPAV